MKKVTIFLLLVIFSRVVAAQENMLAENHLEGKNRKEGISMIEPKRFIMPDSLKRLPELWQRLPKKGDFSDRKDDEKWIGPDNQELFYGSSKAIYSRMPVYNPRIYSKMPVMKIDNSAHYFIKEKRIILINPDEK